MGKENIFPARGSPLCTHDTPDAFDMPPAYLSHYVVGADGVDEDCGGWLEYRFVVLQEVLVLLVCNLRRSLWG